VAGSATAQVLTLVTTPVITRLYEPAFFGIAATFFAVINFLRVFVSLQYESAIVRAKNDSDAILLACICVLLLVFFSVSIVPVFDFTSTLFQGFGFLAEFSNPHGALLLGVTLFLFSLNAVQQSFLNRIGMYKLLAAITIVLQLTYAISALVCGYFYEASAAGLILSSILSVLVSSALIFVAFFCVKKRKIHYEDFKLGNVFVVAREYSLFPRYSVWAMALNSASWQIPLLAILSLFGPHWAGLYALATKFLQMPINLIGKSVGKVFYAEASQLESAGLVSELERLVFNQISSLMVLAFFPCIIILIFSEEICIFVFGAGWLELGLLFKMMVPWLLFWFISSPVSKLLYVKNLQKNEISRHGVLLVLRVCSIFIGALYDDVFVCILLLSISSAFFYLALLVYILRVSNIEFRKILERVGPFIIKGLIFSSILIVLKVLSLNWLLIISVASIFMLIYLYRSYLFLNAEEVC